MRLEKIKIKFKTQIAHDLGGVEEANIFKAKMVTLWHAFAWLIVPLCSCSVLTTIALKLS
jgi:hypothetical protein